MKHPSGWREALPDPTPIRSRGPQTGLKLEARPEYGSGDDVKE